MLVRGGASAVGTAAIQLAVAAGARVIAVAGGPEKGRSAASSAPSWCSTTRRTTCSTRSWTHTDGRGADVIFDPIGGEETETMWTCAARGGRYLAVGFNDDPSRA